MSSKSSLLGLAAVGLLASAACQGGSDSPPPRPTPAPAFEEDRAWTHLEAQVAMGPRPSGSAKNAELRDYLVRELTSYGLKPVREPFLAKGTPAGDIQMENVYADLEAEVAEGKEPAPMLVLGAHFDTKRLPFRFVGANDGASETGVLLELARVMAAASPRPFTYRFLFLDGEEAIRREWVDPDNRYGSRHHVKELTKKAGALKRVEAFILIDMVGDADLQLERDSYSTRKLLDIFVATSGELGMKDLFAQYPIPIKDDHQSFKEMGIPALDLIDLRYGARDNEYWHTAEDVIEHCSKESLGKVGRLVLAALPKVEKAYAK